MSSSPRPTTPQSKPRRVYAGISESDFDLSTIPDPRSRLMTPAKVDTDASPRQHPDLNDEVATLSSKLIHAINHQTTLDDSLSQTRVELERAREQIQSLEAQLAKQREMLVGDIWVRRKSVVAEKTNLLSRIAEEKRLRIEAEQEKKRIEQELENLTTELFEEANKMVISAKEDSRKEQDILHRKNDALKAQLADTEGLLKSQQQQLTELKLVMEQMSWDQDNDSATTTPSSPGGSKFDSRDDDTPTSDIGSQSGLSDLITPSYPTSFTHLLQPVLRSDIGAYDDFVNLCKASRRPASRPPSGSQNNLQAGLGLGLMGPVVSVTSMGIPSSASTVSLSSMGSQAPSSTFSLQAPHTPNSSVSGASASSMLAIPALKETKFYKRVLAEDVEPTLRLDIAPGLSWLARRSVISAMSEGSLVVEPVPTTGTYARLSQPQLYPCSLCGENRKDEQYLRMYRFRTSENASAQRYPLCRYCLNRVRSTCDFLGFLRIIKDGHWRTDDEDAEKAAWEESVRLRENMFWSRIGGGVRPISQGFHGHSNSVAEKSPRQSQEESARQGKDIVVASAKPDARADAGESGHEVKDNVEECATMADTTPQPTPLPLPSSAEEQADFTDEKIIFVHDKQAAQPEDTGKVEAYHLEQPQTPPPTPSNRLSSQTLTPHSSESNKRISLRIPGFP
ncbi:rab guanine nucleotide exchange factor S2 [Cytospora paraplurivora]|uniref:Rab guanine nucleotide exchange factor S2 n=1 Tax=Cytospora paraplurivora TaxID=2898453 RepID=A0AAN9YCD8_9PEZI